VDRVAPRNVTVWTVELDQPPAVVDALRAHLDDDEVRSAASRRDDTIRDRYVVAHGALRSILGAQLGVAPVAVVLDRRCRRCGDPAHGKPMVESDALPDAELQFNLSHSGSVAVVAVVTGARVGVDVERLRPRAKLDALAARVLDSKDHADWLDLPEDQQLRAFLERWTAKEAYVKAIGAGITVPLRDVPTEPEGWTVAGFDAPAGTVGRVAVEGYAIVRTTGWTPPVVREGSPEWTRPIDKFRDTAVGSVFAAGLLGLRDALEPPKKDEVAIVRDHAGDPPFKDPFVLRLDPDHPEDSIVMVRPWLRDPDGEPTSSPAPADYTEPESPSPN
jgi:4'-phosphopantetheinyl transferase